MVLSKTFATNKTLKWFNTQMHRVKMTVVTLANVLLSGENFATFSATPGKQI